MLIQIYSGHNHPELRDQLTERTNSQQITKFKKQIKENRLSFFQKHIQNSLLHGTSSSKVVGLIKGNNILTTTNYTIQTKYRK
jgi:hypothetical protein